MTYERKGGALGSATNDALTASRLANLSASEQASKNAEHRVDYEDAAQWIESWADVSAWTLNVAGSIQVSGGAAFASTDGNPQAANRAVPANSGRVRLLASITIPALGGGGGLVMVGFSDEVAAAAPTAGAADLFAVGIDVDSNTPFYWRGSGVGGAGSTTLGAALAAGTYLVVGVIDEVEVSLTLTKADHSIEYTVGIPLSSFGVGANNVQVWNSDSRDLTGGSVGKIAVKGASATVTPRTGVEGVGDFPFITFPVAGAASNQMIRVDLPADYDSRKPLPLVIFNHGHGQTATAPWDQSTTVRPLLQTIKDAGYIIASSSASGDAWGSTTSIEDQLDLYRYVRDHYAIGGVVMLSESMGGLPGLLAIAAGTIPVLGWAGIYPITNLASIYDLGGSFATEIDTVYGIPGSGTYAVQTAGHDPNLLDGRAFRGIPMRMWASSADTVVPKASNATAFAALVEPYAAEVEVVATTGDHGDGSNFDAADLLEFFTRCVAA